MNLKRRGEPRGGLARLSRWVAVGMLMACSWHGRVVAADQSRGANTVMMSPFEVSAASVEFEGWKKMISPNFVVYTDAASTEVRPIIERLEMIFMATQVTMGRRPLVHAPTTIVLPSSRSDWKKLRSKGRVKWRVAATSFDTLAYCSIVEYDWQDTGTAVLYSSTSSLNLQLMGFEQSFSVRRGLTYFFETAEMVDGALKIGAANMRVGLLKSARWFDWGKFFNITPRSPEYTRDSNDVARFGAQAALFTHYLLMHDDETMKTKLLEWDALLVAGNQPTEALFQSCFGMDWTALQSNLKDYLKNGSFTSRLYRFPPESMQFVVTELEVKPVEMRELFVLVQINNQNIDDSKQALDSFLQKGIQTEALKTLLIGACMKWERPEAALELLESLVVNGTTHPEVLAMTAELKLKSSPREFPIGEALGGELLVMAGAALEREPLLVDAIDLWCFVTSMTAEVTPAQVEEIKRYCQQLEGNGRTDNSLVALAVASWRSGDTDRALRICRHLTKSPFTGKSNKATVLKLSEAIAGGATPAEFYAEMIETKPSEKS